MGPSWWPSRCPPLSPQAALLTAPSCARGQLIEGRGNPARGTDGERGCDRCGSACVNACPGSQAWGARSLGRGARGRVSDMPRRGDCAPAASGQGTPGSAWRRVPEEGRRVPAWSKLGRGAGCRGERSLLGQTPTLDAGEHGVKGTGSRAWRQGHGVKGTGSMASTKARSAPLC